MHSFIARLITIIFVSTLLIAASAQAQDQQLINASDRIVFLGDSNTYAGGYIDYLDAFARKKHPEMELELLNLGLPSETASGESEPDHPFPRPNVHTRIANVLKKTKPDVVFICYGMNDGIYHPFSKTRFETFKTGITKAVQLSRDSGAKVILMTPPPFDPLPMKTKGILQPADADKFSWQKIYEDYDGVMKKYADWIMTQREQVDLVVDLHTPFSEALAKERETNADFTASGDGVHFSSFGHKLIAAQILRAMGQEAPDLEFDAEYLKLIRQRQQLLRDAWVTYCGHDRPNTKKGKPLEEATREAELLDQKIQSQLH